MFFRLISGLALIVSAAPSVACDNYPDLPALPGETAEATKERNDRLFDSNVIIGKYEGQKAALKQAQRIYLARVLQRHKLSQTAPLFSIKVEAVHAIRGKVPPKGQVLADEGYNSCERWGGGEATNALPGDWVIVFEGLPKSERNPRGVDSIYARDALIWDLVEEIETFSLDQGGKRP